MALAEHFVAPPHWEWFILGYFFLAGISGGAYTLGTLLRLFRRYSRNSRESSGQTRYPRSPPVTRFQPFGYPATKYATSCVT